MNIATRIIALGVLLVGGALGMTHTQASHAAGNDLVYHGGSVVHQAHLYAIFWRPEVACANVPLIGKACTEYHFEGIPFPGS
jgi:hypothetical protein